MVNLTEIDVLGNLPLHNDGLVHKKFFFNTYHITFIFVILDLLITLGHDLFGLLYNICDNLVRVSTVVIRLDYIHKVRGSNHLMVLVTLETIHTGMLLTTLDTEAMLHQTSLNVSVFSFGEGSRFIVGLLFSIHSNLIVGVEGGNLLVGGGVSHHN